MAKLVAPDKGIRGVDVDKPDGSKRSYDVQKDGTINVENAKDAKKLKAEGFFEAAGASFAHVEGFLCTTESCTHDSVFKVFTCPKCGAANDHREQ